MRTRFHAMTRFVLICSAASLFHFAPARLPDKADAQARPKAGVKSRVAAIEITGNKTLPTNYILHSMKMHVGDLYSHEKLEQDIENILESGGVEQVEGKAEGANRGRITLQFAITETAPAFSLPAKYDANSVPQAQSVSQWDTKNAFVVPFETNADGVVIPAVWLKINGQSPRLFVVDTGCSLPLLIDSAAAKAMQLTAKNTPRPLLGKAVQTTRFDTLALHIPKTTTTEEHDVALPISQALVCDNAFLTDSGYAAPISGIIGINLLRHLYTAMQVDFVAKTLTLYTATNAPLRVAGAVTVPLKLYRLCYFAAILTASGKPCNVLVDTGNAESIVAPNAILDDFLPLDSHAETTQLVGFSGVQDGITYLSPHIRIGNFTEPDVFVSAIEEKDKIPSLGVRLLSRFRLTLDFSHGEITMLRAANYRDILRLPGKTDFGILYADGKKFIQGIPKGSLLDLAGAKNGDRIVQIGTTSLEGKDFGKMTMLLSGYKGEILKLVLQHTDGSTVSADYVRPGLYDEVKEVRGKKYMGVSLAMESGVLVAAGVDPASLAYRAGLRENDVILAIDGKPVRDDLFKTNPDIAFIAPGQEVVFRVKREDVEKPFEVRVKYRKLK